MSIFSRKTSFGATARFGFSGRRSKHGSRHRRSQMKAMSRGRFSGRGARFGI